MSKSLINLNANVLPLIYSVYNNKLTAEHKNSNFSPEYVLLNYNKLLENKQLLQIKKIDKTIVRLNKLTNKIETFSNRNNSLILLNEIQRLRKEQLLPANYHMFNPKLEIQSIEPVNLEKKKLIESRLENKYIESDFNLNKNYISKNLEVKFPLNLLNANSNQKKIKIRNYLKLITAFNRAYISSKHISYKFNSLNNKLVKNIYTILCSTFLKMKCSISKPRMYFSNDLIIFKLFYFPNYEIKKVLKLRKNLIYKKLITFYKFYKIRNTIKNKFRNKNLYNSKNNLISNKFKYMKNSYFSIDDLKYTSPFVNLNSNKLEELCHLLSKLLHKPVQLEVVRLFYPFYDPNVLTNILAKLTNDIKFRYIFNKIFKMAVIKNPTKMIQRKRFSALPGYLTGINLKFAGRFPTQKIVPRKTVKFKEIGSLARKKAILVETARFSNKNRRGSFSITVSTGICLENRII